MEIIGVVRSLGERTEKITIDLLNEQITNIHLIKNTTPFKSTVIECLKLGIEHNVDFMVTCDSDVQPLNNAITNIIKYGQKYDDKLITGYTYSKFFKKREGGIRLWPGKKLKQFLDYTIKNESPLRPEADLHNKFNGLLVNNIFSIHEYEQYYTDIYSRFNLQSLKSQKFSNIISTFKDVDDMDFKVAYHGFFDKTKNFNLSFPNLPEKDKLNNNHIIKKIIDEII
jgi:hypothetical protein